MKKFETIVILKPNATDEEKDKIVNEIKEIVKVTSVEEWGKRKLAYPINKNNEGYYILLNFEDKSNDYSKLNHYYANNENIIKHIIVGKGEDDG